MKDFQKTRRVNSVMMSIISRSLDDKGITLSIEGYLVTSDSAQNPHTLVEIYMDRINIKGYQQVLDLFRKEFIGYLIDDLLIPADHGVHGRFKLLLYVKGPEALK